MITPKFKVQFFLALSEGSESFAKFVKLHPTRSLRFARTLEGKTEEELDIIKKELGL